MARKAKGLELRESIESKGKKYGTCKELSLKNSKRSSKEFSLKNRVKIFCNALETEPNYFNKFKEEVNKSKIADIEIEVIKRGGKDPLDTVKYAIANKDNDQEIWVVFDKDHYDMEPAIKLAKENEIKTAWSNECFELWFLLHFNLVTTSMDRKLCFNKVMEAFKTKFKKDYAKNNTASYDLLKPHMRTAISYYKKLNEMERNLIILIHVLRFTN